MGKVAHVQAPTTHAVVETDASSLADAPRVWYPADPGSHRPGTAPQSSSSAFVPEAASLLGNGWNEEMEMSELTLGDMIKQVPEGQTKLFERSIPDAGDERFFVATQNWEYEPDRMKWLNPVPIQSAPWFGSREKPRISVSTVPAPDVRYDGPSADLVDFYSTTGSDAVLISDRLFRLIEDEDPGSLDHIEVQVRTADGTVPFHAVLPLRLVEAVDPRRTSVLISYEDLGGWMVRRVTFPKGIVFNNDLLLGASSFADLDTHGWYWSKELIARAKESGIRGIIPMSVAAVPQRAVALL
jgi:hypothetical protein